MAKYKKESIVPAVVTGIADYGFFVELENNYSGLCHISEISNEFVKDIHDFVHEGEHIYVEILDADDESKHLKVSIKDIYYKTEEDDARIVESRKGFLPLKKMLPGWINEKMQEYGYDNK